MKSIEEIRRALQRIWDNRTLGFDLTTVDAAIDELESLRKENVKSMAGVEELLGNNEHAQAELVVRREEIAALKAEITTLKAQRDRAELHQKTATSKGRPMSANTPEQTARKPISDERLAQIEGDLGEAERQERGLFPLRIETARSILDRIRVAEERLELICALTDQVIALAVKP